MWDAEHAPENVGFSHNVEARVGRRGERVVVEAITRVQSVDLVADPGHDARTVRVGRASRRDRATPAKPLDAGRSRSATIPSWSRAFARSRRPSCAGFEQEVERLTALEAIHQKRVHRAAAAPRVRFARSGGDRAVGEDGRQRAVPRIAAGGARRAGDARLWWKSGRGWCERSPAATPHAACQSRPQSRDQHSRVCRRCRRTPRVLWKRLREERDWGLGIEGLEQ